MEFIRESDGSWKRQTYDSASEGNGGKDGELHDAALGGVGEYSEAF